MRLYPKSVATGLLTVIALTGCATANVKDVQANRDGYSKDHFNTSTVGSGIAASLKALPAPATAYNHIEIGFDGISHGTDTADKPYHFTQYLTHDENGMWRVVARFSRNDVEYMQRYVLTYLNVVQARWQEVVLERANASLIREVKHITKIDGGLANPQPGGEYVIDVTTGNEPQIVNFIQSKSICKATGTDFEASTLSPALKGQAIKVSCGYYPNGQDIATDVSELAYLRQYGVYVLTATRNGYSNSSLKITNFSAS
ncbi:hypothetical protein [Silvimonas iriomotensis]|uniref:Lipoprotein n=1 Tax=Silvimonas iriomotensis TaxID=449662 RepID=A0ABQ2PCL4_9NEIS|nr:hypothetical protein [Silvimonas iriomotensis]GGP23063.1 hypothetical protein GCM10010970_30630 [Silvimonas iriomotensis]